MFITVSILHEGWEAGSNQICSQVMFEPFKQLFLIILEHSGQKNYFQTLSAFGIHMGHTQSSG
jgi:hypothetical protein